jgi:AraC-like DNA-binding protein
MGMTGLHGPMPTWRREGSDARPTLAAMKAPTSLSRFALRQHVVHGPLASLCRRLVAVDVSTSPQQPLAVVPHGSFILALQTSSGRDEKGLHRMDNLVTHMCHLRSKRASYQPPGNSRTWFAQLTPEAGTLLAAGQSLAGDGPHIPLDQLLGDAAVLEMRDMLAVQPTVDEQLAQLGLWLEHRLLRRRPLPPAARRAAHVASSLFHTPGAGIDALAHAHAVSRRQLERDFKRWLGISPKRASQVARVQAAVRMALQGMRLADVAHALGFTDQAHLSNVVRDVTGRTPTALLQTARNHANSKFSHFAGADLIYLASAGDAIAQDMSETHP